MYQIRQRVQLLPVLGASLLHPRHPLPVPYLDLVHAYGEPAAGGTARVPRGMHALLLYGARSAAGAAIDACRLALLHLRFARTLRRIRSWRPQVVMKTWSFNAGPASEPDDFYLGPLPRWMAARGITAVVLRGDLSGQGDIRFARRVLSAGGTGSLPERLLIPPAAPLIVWLAQVRTAAVLRRMARCERDTAMRGLCQAVSVDVMRRSTTVHALQYYVAREAVRRWRPRAFLTLYEGQPWETAAWTGATAAGEVATVGYQHTVVFPHALNILQPNAGSWESAVPDVVLCLGELTRALMAQGHAGLGTRFILLGTHRRTGREQERLPRPRNRTVLVLPEGTREETTLLARLAVMLASRLPNHRVILRSHPAMRAEQVSPAVRGAGRPDNLELSERLSIEDDFERSSVVLYRGTSAVLYAVLAGLLPVYLQVGEPDVDPLFALDVWRVRAETIDEAAAAIGGYAEGPEQIAAWRRAADFARAYVPPADPRALDALLLAVGVTAP